MQSTQYRLEFYTFYARGSNGLEYGIVKDPVGGPVLVLPRIIGKNKIKEEINKQVPGLYLPDLTLNEEKRSLVE